MGLKNGNDAMKGHIESVCDTKTTLTQSIYKEDAETKHLQNNIKTS